jgi:hypothetical protein
MDPAEVGVSHLYINHQDILADLNILLPIRRFQGVVAEGCVGGLAQCLRPPSAHWIAHPHSSSARPGAFRLV